MMCNSKAMGGRRCATHTFPAYKRHLQECLDAQYPSPEQLVVLLRFATAYASTPKGSVRIEEDLLAYQNDEEDFTGIRATLEKARERGLDNMATYREKELQIKRLSEGLAHSKV